MRTLFAFAILLVASALAAPPPPHAPEELLKIPQKCDDVLSVKVNHNHNASKHIQAQIGEFFKHMQPY